LDSVPKVTSFQNKCTIIRVEVRVWDAQHKAVSYKVCVSILIAYSRIDWFLWLLGGRPGADISKRLDKN